VSSLLALDIPAQWQALPLEGVSGVILVLGASDTGKSTFAHYLFERLSERLPGKAAFLDGDPGQSQLGPPGTLTIGFSIKSGKLGDPDPQSWRWFIGAVSPRGHMLQLVVGAARLMGAAQSVGAQVVVYDTCGLVEPGLGGLALKQAKLDLLRPELVCALQRADELEPLLIPLERRGGVQVLRLRPSAAVVTRDQVTRRRFREAQYSRYFSAARELSLDWTHLSVIPVPGFSLGRLVALEDKQGFTLALGVVSEISRASHKLTLLSPLLDRKEVRALHLGDIRLDPVSGLHETLA